VRPAVRAPAEAPATPASFPTVLLLAAAVLSAAARSPTLFGQVENGGEGSFQPVLIPVDEEGRVSRRDKYAYLPTPLYQAFRQAAQRLDAPPRPWLVRSADYQAAFGWSATGGDILCEGISAKLELDVLKAPVEIVLPLPWRNAGIREDSLRLDDRPLAPDWRQANGGLAFTVEEAGVYRLSAEIVPRVEDDGKDRRVQLPLLPSPRATLEVLYPGRIEEIQIPGVSGWLQRDGLAGELSAELGPVETLSLQWPATDGEPPSARPPRVEQFTWLHVQPDALVLDAKWKFLGPGDAVEALDLLVPDHLLLLPSTARQLATFVQSRRGDRQSLRLQFDRPRQPPFEFQVSFVVQGGVGLGAPAAPAIDVMNADVAQQWFAVSVDPALELRDTTVQGAEAVTETQFRSDWGESPAAPRYAYRVTDRDFAWACQTRLAETQITGESRLDALYRRDAVDLTYRADLDAGSGYRVMYRLQAPPAMRVSRVSVRESDAERVDHWAQQPSGEITVFLNGRVTGPHQLELQGRVPLALRGADDMPQVHLRDAGAVKASLYVYRTPEVSLQLVAAEGASPQSTAQPETYVPAWGRFVASFQRDAAADPSQTRIAWEATPNRPRTSRKRLVATLAPQEGDWAVEAELALQVNQGAIDAVRFDAPQSLVGPWTVDPPGQVETRELTAAKRRTLIVRPDRPLTGAVRVRLRGLLRAPPGQALRAPDIEPLDLGEMPQFLALPRQWKEQPLAWESFGMRAEPLPMAGVPASSPENVLYRVVNKPHYGAVLRQVEQSAGDPRVRLVDVRAILQTPNRFWATAVFDLEPAGLRQCILELPAGTQLIHAGIEGRAMLPVRLNEQKHILDLGREQVPLRLTAVYRGQVSKDKDETDGTIIPAPILVDVPVERTLWTVASASPELRISLSGQPAILRERQDWIRLQSMEDVLDLSAEVEAEQSPEALRRWYLPWARRWSQIDRRLGPAFKSLPEGPSRDQLRREQQALAERYGVKDLNEQETQEAGASAEEWPLFAEPAVRCDVRGAAPALSLHVEKSAAASPRTEGLAALGTVLVALSGAWFFRRGVQAEWLLRWLPLLLTASGVAWWLWLAPSVLGLAIAGAGAWLALGPRSVVWSEASRSGFSSSASWKG
jgi:hypothetical protein